MDNLIAVIEYLARKTPVGSPLRSADWKEVPGELRQRAQFSSGVEQMRVVQGITDKLAEWADSVHRDPERAFMGRSKFVAEMRGIIGAAPGDSGELTDIASRRRLELIYDFQTFQAQSYAQFKLADTPEHREEFPCDELVRYEEPEHPRGDPIYKAGTEASISW